MGDGAVFYECDEGGVVHFWGAAVFSWAADDVVDRKLAAVQLARGRIVPQAVIATAFGVDISTLWHWEKALRDRGAANLAGAKPGPKGAWKVTPEVRERVRALRAEGLSIREAAEEAGVSR